MSPPPRPRAEGGSYRWERCERGHRLVGPGLLVWEATRMEVRDWERELAPVVAGPGARGGDRAAPAPAASVYGPVSSPLLGRTLGVSLAPRSRRVCNFDCVYCPFAALAEPDAPARRRARWPRPERVAARLRAALRSAGPLDAVVIAGHGEPTLHPRFAEIAERIADVLRRERPRAGLWVVTNGSRLLRPEVGRALEPLEGAVVKVDAAPERVDRPARSAPLGALVAGIVRLRRPALLRACFVEGTVANTGPRAVREWTELVAELRPRGVAIRTIGRPGAGPGLRPVAPARLREIAAGLRRHAGLEPLVAA